MVFATLRGPLFAICDEELLEWRHRFGRFHPFSRAVSAFRSTDHQNTKSPDVATHLLPIAQALALLRSLHTNRNQRPVADTIHRILDATRAHVSFVLRAHGDQVLGNVLQVAELARQYELDGGLSFRGFVEYLAQEPERTESTNSLPPIICAHCGGPIVRGQSIGPLFSAKLIKWSAHPVLSKPVMLRGVIPADGSPGRRDLSLGEQLRQRAAMGGEKERAELAAFEALLAKSIADALVAQLRDEAAAHGVDVWTWLAREHGKGGA